MQSKNYFKVDFSPISYIFTKRDLSLTSVTSSHVQIWKIVAKIVVGVNVL
jgi:hypothetical protein